MQFPVLKCIMSLYLGLKYMHLCFNECMNVSLSMGVYLCHGSKLLYKRINIFSNLYPTCNKLIPSKGCPIILLRVVKCYLVCNMVKSV